MDTTQKDWFGSKAAWNKTVSMKGSIQKIRSFFPVFCLISLWRLLIPPKFFQGLFLSLFLLSLRFPSLLFYCQSKDLPDKNFHQHQYGCQKHSSIQKCRICKSFGITKMKADPRTKRIEQPHPFSIQKIQQQMGKIAHRKINS